METKQVETAQNSSGFGCNLMLWAGGLAFLALMIVVLVPNVMEFAASRFFCPNAVEVLSSSRDGGSVQTRAGSASSVATTVTTLSCVFEDGSESTIGNDTMVVTGMALAIASGAGLGLLITLVLQLLAILKRPR